MTTPIEGKPRPIFVTGATGNVGRELVAALQRKGAPFRIGDRAPESIKPSANCAVVRFDFLDPTTYAPAVAGCGSIFLLRPPAISNTRETLNRFIDVARAKGVDQIVFVSVAGAATNPIVPHHAVELHLRNGPPNWTILQPGFFAQNLESAYLSDICHHDRIYVPAGRGKVAFIDTRDLATVAVQALFEPAAHAGKAYTLTGQAALSFVEVAALLSQNVGRTIRYVPASAVGYLGHLLKARLPVAQALVQTILHVGLRFGQAATIDPTLSTLLGTAPLTMADYIRDHRNMWAKGAGESAKQYSVRE